MAQERAIAAAKQYADAVRRMMHPKAVLLYGSHAKGTATKYSDIDVAVIVDHIEGDYLQLLSRLWALTNGINDEIEPVLLTEEDGESGFLQTVYTTGIAV